ncbi:MAG: hypothetical protein F4065_02475 [Rhodothermaceae bacterium]|nr:hypothetical protein [Rhodothermaceae bacterium]MXX96779.1 hypothetical protein [Rhodothermaceae bacterium]MXZ57476.1 hypothetical protein [Rhodothermaceae bacterium]MYB90460.1 hypothetical protein [Rhodothermaceae bacterium]MYC04730.1 hypothetical protein [Rhodothermaceae bacterium]
MINPQEASKQYGHFMRRIWYRIDVISRCRANSEYSKLMTGYSHVDVDLCYLQLRKCFELMMFASVLAHDSFGHELGKKILNKEWKPGKIIEKMRQVNPDFYPIPIHETSSGTSGARKSERLKDGFLTELEFAQAYGHCGDWLHAKREDPYRDLDMCWQKIQNYETKLVRLLKHHFILLTDSLILEAKMPEKLSGEVEVIILTHSTPDGPVDLHHNHAP